MSKTALSVGALLLAAVSFGVGTWYSHQSQAGGKKILYYHDPMHPAYKSDKPGIAPDCGMELVPVYEDGSSGAAADNSMPVGSVKMDAFEQQLLGIRTEAPKKGSGAFTLRTSGRVVPEEGRVYRVTAAVDGFIRKTFVPTTGSPVRKDDKLATFYSPEFYTAESSYLYALNAVEKFRAVGKEPPETVQMEMSFGRPKDPRYPEPAHTSNVQRTKDTLRNLGMPEVQLEELARTREITQDILIVSPTNGHVLSRNVSAGERFTNGTTLYTVADLSRVWVLADVFEHEAQYLVPGTKAQVVLRQSGKTFVGRVSDVLPQFDPGSRTLKLRLAVDNPGFTLRPDMFVDVQLPVNLPAVLTVPVDAVLDSGIRKVVFVEHANGYFEPRQVETGWRTGGRVAIVSGLGPGERIAVSGNFLLDSESKLKLAAAGIYGESSKDPVCKMDVDLGKARAANRSSEYLGKTYYFCSDQCRKQFVQEPAKFAAPALKPAALPPPSATQQSGAAVDLICKMEVDKAEAQKAGLTATYQGQTYYFCNPKCKREFESNPAKALKDQGPSPAHRGGSHD